MTGNDLRTLRRSMGLSVHAFGALLGYTGNANTIRKLLWQYETGERDIPPRIILRCQELEREAAR